MKNPMRFLSILMCLVMVISAISITVAAVDYDPEVGAFAFTSEEMLSYITGVHNLDTSFDTTEKSLKLTVNSSASDPDPYFFIDFSKLSTTLNADNYPYMVITYRSPSTVSANAKATEVFLCAGSVTGPTGGKSVIYNTSKSGNYLSQTIDLSALSWWTGDIHTIRIDPYCSAKLNDTLYIDSVILCRNKLMANSVVEDRANNTYNPIDIYKNSDYVCTAYDVTKYTSPMWKGNIVYNEAVYPIMDANGNATYTLMYTPEEVMCLYSSNFASYYTQGIDYKVEGNKLTILKTGSIPLKTYNYIHNASSGYNHTSSGLPGKEYWGQSAEFFDGYLNITYTHNDAWNGYVPENKSDLLPITADKITNKESINIVYFGDSICGGANASSYRNVYPYAEWWNEQISSKLIKDYGVPVNETISSVGGSTASGMVKEVQNSVIKYNPDLVFIEYGVNDAMNASQDGDYNASRLKSEFKSGIEQMIKTIRASLPNCEIVLVAPFYSNPLCHYMSYFEACRDALAELEEQYSGVAMADVTKFHEYLLTFKDYLDTSGDNMCHPNDFMSKVFSQVCLETIVPGGVEAYVPNGNAPDTEKPEIQPTTGTSAASPIGHGWLWPTEEAYGYFGGYGTNSQDIELSVDLCLLPNTKDESIARLWTKDGSHITVAPTYVTIGGKTSAYNWGEVSLSNWHSVKFTIKNGTANIYIDGELVGSGTGVVAYDSYQMLFSQTGSMCIDNLKMTDSSGKVYFDCDFENANDAESLCGDGLGAHTSLGVNTIFFDLNGGEGSLPNQIKVSGLPLSLTTVQPEREGYKFLGWANSNSATEAEFVPGETYSGDNSATLYAVWEDNSKPVYPEIESITPQSATITDTGSIVYTMIANGDGITYKWSCTSENDAALTLTGDDSLSLTVSVTEQQKEDFTATFVCTVTNSLGNSVESAPVTLNYKTTYSERTPGDIDGDGIRNTVDYNIMRRVMIGSMKLTDTELAAADLNSDGIVNTTDCNMLARILLGA